MSAFVVCKEHINAMIVAGLRRRSDPLIWYHDGQWHKLTDENTDEVGRMLPDENVKSVMHRYDDCEITDLPGRCDAEWLIPFKFRLTYGPTAVEALKITRCYIYQSCEHPEWETSQAKEFCEALTLAQFDRLPGYEAAPWEWEKPITELHRIR